jgi:hypothetical protein
MRIAEDRCPRCGGSSLEVGRRGYVRCLNAVIVAFVPPPGAPPWLPLQPVPIEGVCGHTFRSSRWLNRRATLLLASVPSTFASASGPQPFTNATGLSVLSDLLLPEPYSGRAGG